jgi:fructokinase
MANNMKIGIDLGGTKIEGILLDNDGSVVSRQRRDTPRGDYQQLLHAITASIKTLSNIATDTCTVGIGTPGSIGPDGLLRNSNTTELNGQSLQQDLEKLLGQTIRIANDANCFALSEAIDGAGAKYATVFGVILGTGTGGGIVINKQLLDGCNHIGGEWGHNQLPWATPDELPGDLCYCGQHGCIETFLSGPGLARSYQKLSNKKLSTREIFAQSEQGNENARTVIDIYEDQLARALASVINILDPHCIILGGGLSNIDRLYANVKARWGKTIFSNSIRTELLSPVHGDSSGVRGAAWLWNDAQQSF